MLLSTEQVFNAFKKNQLVDVLYSVPYLLVQQTIACMCTVVFQMSTIACYWTAPSPGPPLEARAFGVAVGP